MDECPVYVCNSSEGLQGAAFLYFGKRIQVLNARGLLLRRFEDQPGTTLVIDSYCEDSQLSSSLQSKGYGLLLQKKYGKASGVCVYSNSS